MLIKIIISSSLLALFALFSHQVLIPTHNEATSISLLERQSEDNVKKKSASNIWSQEIQDIIKIISTEYTSEIHKTHIQAKLIYIRESLRNNLLEPVEDNIKSVLTIAFPTYENLILSAWQRMDQYESWLIEQNRTLMELNELSRNGMLWEKRNELFPIAAADIWSKEQDRYEAAQFNLHREIDLLDQSEDIPIIEKIQRLKNSFQQADGILKRSINQQTGIHKNTIASVLFGMNSVQKELFQLDSINRQLEINAVRRELGYDEENIIKMSEIDQQREQRWNNGYAYMKSRDNLIASNNQPSEDQLNTLRSHFFGKSALTIAREEKNGFYRFQRPRYYGRN